MAITFEEYIKKIEEDFRRGNATEYTYRGALELLIESYGKGVDASNDPKHIACGAPDFIVEKGKVPLGYIETKDVNADLDKVEKSEQMKRYLPALHNLILTDYVEFRWYVNGERKLKFRTADFGKNSKLLVNPKASETIEQLFKDFLATETPTVETPKELAQRLASVTQFIRDQIANALESGDPDLQKVLNQQYKTFVELLLPELKPREFADLYAQAITYGLFAAKLSAPKGADFAFEDAYKYLRANPFLRRLFLDVNEQLDEMDIIQPYLKDLVSLLNRAHFDEILADFGKRTRTEDPVVHFYETFLATYDPKLRESRGVYYTPEPVVQFIVRSVDEILKTRFNKPWGLADESVKVLDPATGTGTFLYYVIQQVHNEVVNERGQGGLWAQKSKSLLKRLFGFELLIAPYVVSHLKLGLLMQSLGAPLEGKDERLHIYLTNALEEGKEPAEMLTGLGVNIAVESSEANKVKNDDEIMVVIGNPPYSNFGKMNKGKWITDLLSTYKQGLNEQKNNINDDFIKFIRYGQWRIERAGSGVLAFITNNTYIDGITHRAMRKALSSTFDEIFIINLHGSSKKGEITPNGLKDENVFDIQTGVAISLFIKNKNRKLGSPSLDYFELWGSREDKYRALQNMRFLETNWVEIPIIEPNYFFTEQNSQNDEYAAYPKIGEVFNENVSGIQTGRDEFVSKINETEFEEWVGSLIDNNKNDSDISKIIELPIWNNFQLNNFRIKIKDNKYRKSITKKWLYRPFDIRPLFFDENCIKRTRGKIMANLLQPNLGIITTRQLAVNGFRHIFVTDQIGDGNTISMNTREYNYYFPLYIYDELNLQVSLFDQSKPHRKPNLSADFLNGLTKKLRIDFITDGQGDLIKTFGPEDVFYYAYAVFHSPTYRSRYAEFLKIDFPRLPLTSDKKLFAALVAKGKELVELHLLKSAKVEDFVTTYPVAGENCVEKVSFLVEDHISRRGAEIAEKTKPIIQPIRVGKVWINATQFFGNVPEAVWNFKIGGYQVCDKWLKDRKGRVLSGEDISHYQRVVVSLKETMRVMKEIDQVIPRWPME